MKRRKSRSKYVCTCQNTPVGGLLVLRCRVLSERLANSSQDFTMGWLVGFAGSATSSSRMLQLSPVYADDAILLCLTKLQAN